MKSCTCCVSFIAIVSPSEAELLTYESERTGRFYSTFTKAMEPLVLQRKDKIVKLVGEGLFSYFPQTKDFTNIEAIRDVLECCLQQIEKRQSLSNEMSCEITTEFSYRISADYEALVDWDGVFDPSHPRRLQIVYEICSKTPPNTVALGGDLYTKIISLARLNEEYSFESIGKHMIDSGKNGTYSFLFLENHGRLDSN